VSRLASQNTPEQKYDERAHIREENTPHIYTLSSVQRIKHNIHNKTSFIHKYKNIYRVLTYYMNRNKIKKQKFYDCKRKEIQILELHDTFNVPLLLQNL